MTDAEIDAKLKELRARATQQPISYKMLFDETLEIACEQFKRAIFAECKPPDDLAGRIASVAERLDSMSTFEHTPPSLIQGEADILRKITIELRSLNSK